MTPETAINLVGDEHTVTATVTDGAGIPQSGITVFFEVIDGPNTGDSGSDITDSEAPFAATFTYTGDGGAGTDVIQACYEEQPGILVCSQSVTKTWNPPQEIQYDITLTPDYALNLVGQAHKVTATVLVDGEEPETAIEVTFRVISGPNAGKIGSVNTTAGAAEYTYTGDGGVGIDDIQACITIGEDEICSNVVEKEWTGETITLDPLLAINRLDENQDSHTVKATIKDLKGNFLGGVDVTFFIISGPNSSLPNATFTTDLNGEASFSYDSNNTTGTDVIRACFTNAASEVVCTDYGNTFDNDAFKEWQDGEDPVCPSISVNPPEFPTGVLGEDYSFQFTGFGGTGTYTFAWTSEDLPNGLTLNSEGLVSGAPEEAGEFTFTVTATDTNECPGSREYTLLVCPTIILEQEAGNLPDAYVDQFYSTTITASTEPDAFFQLNGNLPPGLTEAQGSYIISGTPTQPGTYTFSITASTALGCTDTKEYRIRVFGQTAIPTLSEWGMIILALMLAGFSIFTIRRQQSER